MNKTFYARKTFNKDGGKFTKGTAYPLHATRTGLNTLISDDGVTVNFGTRNQAKYFRVVKGETIAVTPKLNGSTKSFSLLSHTQWLNERKTQLIDAIQDCVFEQKELSDEWVSEYNSLVK